MSVKCQILIVLLLAQVGSAAEPLIIGSQRELFVDDYLSAAKTNVHLLLHEPIDRGSVMPFNAPWEGPFCAYVTILRDGGGFRAYYRGKAGSTPDGMGEVTCVSESIDGSNWSRPNLGLIEINNTRSNNVILADNHFSHNFSPFLDANPNRSPAERYKAISGDQKSGLKAFISSDGLHWKPMQDDPVFTTKNVPHFSYMFDSQNVAFWSESEKNYLLYFRVYQNHFRRIARAQSVDFVHWNHVQLMNYRGADGRAVPVENLYTSQTSPYFRAPDLYVAIAARFMPGRQVLTEAEATAIGVHPSYFKDISDAVFMTSRGGDVYDRTFMSAFIRPGIGAENWVSRTTYPALNVVPTGTNEMSIYVNQNYAQPTSNLHRYSLRLDGFSSLHAPYEGGTVVTPPLKFTGNRLMLNFSTSAAGGIRIALLNGKGKAIPGYGLSDSVELIGNEIERAARWKNGPNVGSLSNQTVRLLFQMKDADLYALQFVDQK